MLSEKLVEFTWIGIRKCAKVVCWQNEENRSGRKEFVAKEKIDPKNKHKLKKKLKLQEEKYKRWKKFSWSKKLKVTEMVKQEMEKKATCFSLNT